MKLLDMDTPDTRAPIVSRGWGPGNYVCKCLSCEGLFFGDKGAWKCAVCAYGDNEAKHEELEIEAQAEG